MNIDEILIEFKKQNKNLRELIHINYAYLNFVHTKQVTTNKITKDELKLLKRILVFINENYKSFILCKRLERVLSNIEDIVLRIFNNNTNNYHYFSNNFQNYYSIFWRLFGSQYEGIRLNLIKATNRFSIGFNKSRIKYIANIDEPLNDTSDNFDRLLKFNNKDVFQSKVLNELCTTYFKENGFFWENRISVYAPPFLNSFKYSNTNIIFPVLFNLLITSSINTPNKTLLSYIQYLITDNSNYKYNESYIRQIKLLELLIQYFNFINNTDVNEIRLDEFDCFESHVNIINTYITELLKPCMNEESYDILVLHLQLNDSYIGY